MADTVDMSVLLQGEPRQVRFTRDGPEIAFPVDIPIALGMKFEKLTERAQAAMRTASEGGQADDATLVEDLYDAILRLAQAEDPQISEIEIGMSQLLLFFQSVYGGLDLAAIAKAGSEDPTKRPARARGTTKTRSTSPKKTAAKKNSRRSSTSSRN